jgi:hypothetical protein
MIPDILRDKTTLIKNHTLKTYIFCILLRIFIGLLVIADKIPVTILQILSIFVIVTFLLKFIKIEKIWKNYLRTVLVYSIVLFLITKYKSRYIELAGLLIIFDSLMGLQTYHNFNQIGYLFMN